MVALVYLLALIASTGCWPEPPGGPTCDSAPSLAFSIMAQPNVVTHRQMIRVSWTLKNISEKSVLLSRWPGPVFRPMWEAPPDSTLFLDVPERASSAAPAPGDFVNLNAGESMTGKADIEVFPTPTGKLMLRGEFRSDDPGDRSRVQIWRGRTCSPWIAINVPKGDPFEGKRAN